jgi:hypothetical protein
MTADHRANRLLPACSAPQASYDGSIGRALRLLEYAAVRCFRGDVLAVQARCKAHAGGNPVEHPDETASCEEAKHIREHARKLLPRLSEHQHVKRTTEVSRSMQGVIETDREDNGSGSIGND